MASCSSFGLPIHAQPLRLFVTTRADTRLWIWNRTQVGPTAHITRCLPSVQVTLTLRIRGNCPNCILGTGTSDASALAIPDHYSSTNFWSIQTNRTDQRPKHQETQIHNCTLCSACANFVAFSLDNRSGEALLPWSMAFHSLCSGLIDAVAPYGLHFRRRLCRSLQLSRNAAAVHTTPSSMTLLPSTLLKHPVASWRGVSHL